MSQGGYQEFGGNPYAGTGSGTGSGFAGSNPYGRTNEPTVYASSNPYGGGAQDYQSNTRPPIPHEPESDYSQPSQYNAPISQTPSTQPLNRDEFLQRIDAVKQQINHLTTSISSIATIHQRILSSPESGAPSSQLESITTQTQVQNTRIKDQIKNLEVDAARDPRNQFKKTQVENLKRAFREQLKEYEKEEQLYRQRYREALARQYKIVNPEASEEEVEQASNADWGDEGVFQTALKTNRSAAAYSVLNAVRSRHNEIQRIERTLFELATLFQEMSEMVMVQGEQIAHIDSQAQGVQQDTEQANREIAKAVVSARRRQKLKWWLVGVIVAIIVVLALVLGLYFGLTNRNNNNGGGNNNNNSNNGNNGGQ